jgi:hypothetical protein
MRRSLAIFHTQWSPIRLKENRETVFPNASGQRQAALRWPTQQRIQLEHRSGKNNPKNHADKHNKRGSHRGRFRHNVVSPRKIDLLSKIWTKQLDIPSSSIGFPEKILTIPSITRVTTLRESFSSNVEQYQGRPVAENERLAPI